jgi:hypothetical protein
MTNQPARGAAPPILTVVVDQLIEFSDKAVDDPAELEDLTGTPTPDRTPFNVVDQLIEFTETPVSSPAELNGKEETTQASRTEPAA